MQVTQFLIVSLFLVPNIQCFKILILMPFPGKSHFVIAEPIVKKLVERQHNVTFVSYFSTGMKQNENYKEVILERILPPANTIDIALNSGEPNIADVFTGMFILAEEAYDICDSSLSQYKLQELISREERYDLIMMEYFFGDCFIAFADKFKTPVVGLSTTTILTWHNERFGNIYNPAYIPNGQNVFNDRLDFWERVNNFLFIHLSLSFYDIYITKKDKTFIRKYFGAEIPDMETFIKDRSSLLLVNTHRSLHSNRPLVPSIIEIGGIHVSSEERPPKNIEKFINESTHGVIYFSLGSMIKGHTFPQEKREEFLRAFARLPQRVLWKWENETMPGKPDNVMIQKWMPQFDILSHPNVKAFISHGGLLGVTEAVHCGVPMMVMPQYGDQHTNAKAVEANGGGVILYLKDATEETVYQNLKTILSPEFKAKATALSERFRDRPMSPMDTAIYWVEYVARHKGAPHLKTAAVDMPLYQYLLLDVIAFLAAIVLIFLYISYKITCLIFRALFARKKVKQN